jgi:hypothetical protein
MDWNIRHLLQKKAEKEQQTEKLGSGIKTFIMAGQSNMIGLGKPDEVTPNDLFVPDNLRLFQQVWNTKGDVEDIFRRGTFGPELSFAQKIGAFYGAEEFLVIKFAAAGTAIESWLPTYQRPSPVERDKYRDNYFTRMMEFVDPICHKNNAELCAFIWVQGRRDAGSKVRINQYKDNLNHFITNLRAHWNNPKLPFIFSQAPDHPGDLPMVLAELMHRFPFNHDLRHKQAEFAAANEHVHMVSTEGLRPCPDFLYLNSKSTMALGHRLAETYLQLVSAA